VYDRTCVLGLVFSILTGCALHVILASFSAIIGSVIRVRATTGNPAPGFLGSEEFGTQEPPSRGVSSHSARPFRQLGVPRTKRALGQGVAPGLYPKLRACDRPRGDFARLACYRTQPRGPQMGVPILIDPAALERARRRSCLDLVFFAGISRPANYNGGGHAAPSAGSGKASQHRVQPAHSPDRLPASGRRQDQAEQRLLYGRTAPPVYPCHRQGELLNQLFPKTMPEFRAGHIVILAEILAHFKHEIGSVIRPLATPAGPPNGAQPTRSAAAESRPARRVACAEVEDQRRGSHEAVESGCEQPAGEPSGPVFRGRLPEGGALRRGLEGERIALAELGPRCEPCPDAAALRGCF
jgi:hypothetical protein